MVGVRKDWNGIGLVPHKLYIHTFTILISIDVCGYKAPVGGVTLRNSCVDVKV